MKKNYILQFEKKNKMMTLKKVYSNSSELITSKNKRRLIPVLSLNYFKKKGKKDDT